MPPSLRHSFPFVSQPIASLWSKNSVDLASPVSIMILHPTSFTSAIDLGPIAPNVSIDTGQNQWLVGRHIIIVSVQILQVWREVDN